ncbi:MAG: phosphate ABC transporter substrate-binding protein [Planctomycetes bacterium]|nr:phosphate ABC transporter substrate-binding protein [Planctomycetota bacterium]
MSKTLVCLSMGAVLASPVAAQFPLAARADASIRVDRHLPLYDPIAGVAGSIVSVGSDTMNNAMTQWGESFVELYPDVAIEVEGRGSNTAPPALVEGKAAFGPMSRPMTADEFDAFEQRHGYQPTGIVTSIDMLAVYVHKDNPIAALSLPQVDAIFGKTRNGGAPKDIATWGDLGLTGEWAKKPIALYGRNAASGSHVYFKEHALFDGQFKDSVEQQPRSAAVVQSIATDRFGIGYGGIGARSAEVRPVPLAWTTAELEQGKAVPAVAAKAYSGEYPMARFLYLYVDLAPGTELEPLRREFLRYILSRQGQTDVVEQGYLPLPAGLVAAQIVKFLGAQ